MGTWTASSFTGTLLSFIPSNSYTRIRIFPVNLAPFLCDFDWNYEDESVVICENRWLFVGKEQEKEEK